MDNAKARDYEAITAEIIDRLGAKPRRAGIAYVRGCDTVCYRYIVLERYDVTQYMGEGWDDTARDRRETVRQVTGWAQFGGGELASKFGGQPVMKTFKHRVLIYQRCGINV